MLQCLRQSVCTAQTSLIPKKSSPWHWSKVIRALCFTSGHSILNAEHSPNPGPTNHRATFALKQNLPTASCPCIARHFWVKGFSSASSLCESCRKHPFVAVIVPPSVKSWNQTHLWQPVCSKSWVTSKNHNVNLSFIFKTAAFHNRELLPCNFLIPLHPKNSAGINTCPTATAGKVFHYPITTAGLSLPLMEAPRNHCHAWQAHAVSLILFFFFNFYFY